MAGRSYQRKDLESLFGLAAGRCSFPDCRGKLLHWADSPDDPVVLGQVAHIVASSDKGPRAQPSMPEADRNKYENLILLCSSHHKLIDTLDSTYSVDQLKAFKVMHERWVEDTLTQSMDKIVSAELDVVCKAIQTSTVLPSTGLRAVPPEEKMSHNALGESSARYLTIGLMRSDAVAHFLELMASQLDPSFPGRLRSGFVAEYELLWGKGLRGDSLFFALTHFAAGGPGQEFERHAAGLAVLSHLFQVCDVFEEPPR